MKDALSGNLPETMISVEPLDGLEKKLDYVSRYNNLTFACLQQDAYIGQYKITDYDTSSGAYWAFNYSYWVEAESPDSRRVKVDFSEEKAYGTNEDIKYVLENFPIIDWNPEDI